MYYKGVSGSTKLYSAWIWPSSVFSFLSHMTMKGEVLVFAGSVLWTMDQSIFWLWLPKLGVILVSSCHISKIIQNHSKTGWNQLQPVKQSHVLHSLVTTFITFNLIFGSSKTVKNWERYNQIHFTTCTRMTLILTHSNFHHFASFYFWIWKF